MSPRSPVERHALAPAPRTVSAAPPSLRTAVGLLLALGAAAAMGSAAAAMKAMGTSGLSALNIAQARTILAGATLMTLAVLVRRGRVRLRTDAWWLVAALGAVSLAANHVFFILSLSRLPVGVALLVEYLAPFLVASWVWLVGRQPLSPMTWVGMAGALTGMALVGQVHTGFALDGIGCALGLLAAATMASRFLLTEHGLRGVDPLVLAAWATTASAATMLITMPFDAFPTSALPHQVDLPHGHLPAWALVAWVGLVGSAGGVLLCMAAQRLLPPTSVSALLTLEVVVGAALGHGLLGEGLTATQVIGGALMLAGAVVGQLAVPALARRRSGTGEGPATSVVTASEEAGSTHRALSD